MPLNKPTPEFGFGAQHLDPDHSKASRMRTSVRSMPMLLSRFEILTSEPRFSPPTSRTAMMS